MTELISHITSQVMKWLGLFDTNALVARKSVATQQTPLDALCDAMLARMQYAPGERDLLVMKHTFVAEYEVREPLA